MAQEFSCFLLSLSLSFLAAILIMSIFLFRSKNLPPGQMGFPWIGETMDFYRAQRRNRLFEDFVGPRVAKFGKIFKTSLMGSPTVVVNGAEANRFFLSNEFKLVVSSWPSASVQLMGEECIMQKQGESHRCVRGLIGASLAGSSLEAMMPKLSSTIRSHLDTNWLGRDTIGLFHSAKVLTFTIVFECLMGIGVEPDVLRTFERVLEGVFAPPFRLLSYHSFVCILNILLSLVNHYLRYQYVEVSLSQKINLSQVSWLKVFESQESTVRDRENVEGSGEREEEEN